MDKLKIESKFKDLIPPLISDEYERLEELLRKEGIRDAITTWNGIIVDGHNRYEIAEKYSLDYTTTEKKFSDESEAMMWIIDTQLGRRNISGLDRIELAKKKEPLIREKAKLNMSLGGGDKKSGWQKSANPIPVIHTRGELAKIAGLSHDTFSKGEKILEKASPELIQEVREGKKKINTAYREIQTGTVVCKNCGNEKLASEFSTARKSFCLDCENAYKREIKKARKETQKGGETSQISPKINKITAINEAEPCVTPNPEYNIDAFQLEFRENTKTYISGVEGFITGHYSHLWETKNNKEIAITVLDEAITAIEKMKGLMQP